jgi:prolyl oligopeptidase
MGIPKKHGDYYYFSYNSGLQDQSLVYKMKEKNKRQLNIKDPLDVAELFMDPKKMSKDGKGQMASQAFSDDGKYLAYFLSYKGSDWKSAHVYDVNTKEIMNDELNWIKFSAIDWTEDSKGFFYTKFDAPKNQKKSKNMTDKAGSET